MLERDIMELGFHICKYGESGYNLNLAAADSVHTYEEMEMCDQKEGKKERERERVSYSGCYNKT